MFHRTSRGGSVGMASLIAASAAFAGSAASARAADWYVDPTYPSCSASDGSQDKPFCTIVTAVTAADYGDTIWIAPGVYVESIDLAKDLALIGTSGAAVTILDGNASQRVMSVRPGVNVHLSNLTIQHGSDPTAAGAGGCYVGGSMLTITDCVLTENEGALVVANGALTMNRCLVTKNSARPAKGGAGIRAFVGGATLTISDSRFESNRAVSGGAIQAAFGGTTTLERCHFSANVALGNSTQPGLGGALEGDSFTAVDCVFSDNVASPQLRKKGGEGGAVFAWGPSQFERCRFSGNIADAGASQSRGGAITIEAAFGISGTATFIDCEIVENVCASTVSGSSYGGTGGGVCIGGYGHSTASFIRCTVAGNRAEEVNSGGGLGGGIFTENFYVITLAHTVVAGNEGSDLGPDLWARSMLTLGWNVIGDATGANFTGSDPNDLLDVDPLFADPSLGDWSLQPTSPAIDSGDPAVAVGGKDLAQTPRMLDGGLDRAIRIDRGAHEFSHVRLAVTGTFAPGGTLTVDVTGSAGLPVLLVAGIGEAEFVLKPFGSLFVDLSFGSVILPWGVVPSTTPCAIDPSLPAPFDVYVQALATSGRAGNLSNLVAFTIE